jgi:phenylacetic acid degradation operon negative regulatory protein
MRSGQALKWREMASTTLRKKPSRPGSDTRVAQNADGRLPRSQVGTNPQHLLITLLGDYWYGRTEHLPSAALVELLAEFDISQPSARAAMNRLTKRGLLLSSKRGRNTYCGVNPGSLPLLKGTFSRVVAFGTHESRAWDGKWTMVAFSIPETQRQLRHAVRTNLRWLGYAALYDGLWCSPWDDQDTVLAKLSELDVGSATVVRAAVDPRSTLQPLSGWDLDALRRKYIEFEKEFSPILADARRGALTASQALVNRTKVMDSWRNFIGLEPDLPTELLPQDWPRSRMRALCFELHDSLAPVAQARCEQIFAKYSPELAALVTHQTAADLVR